MDSAHLNLRSRFHRPFLPFSSDQSSCKKEVPSTPPIITMTEDDIPTTEEMRPSRDIWSTPTSMSRPTTSATMPEGFSFDLSMGQSPQHSMTSPSIPFQHLSCDSHSRPASMHQDFDGPLGHDHSAMSHKPYEHSFAFQGYTPDMQIGQAFTADEAIPIFDLDHEALQSGGYSLPFDEEMNSRRISGSSFTVSTSGGASDMPPYEDFSAALSDAPSFCSEYPPPSNRNSWMSSTPLSPVVSPRLGPQSRTELVRTQSRGRASPSPRPNVRSAPYSIEPSRGKRWSTGSYGPGVSRRAPPAYLYHVGNDQCMSQQPTSQPPFMMPACPPAHQRNSMLLPTQLPSQALHSDHRVFENPPPLMSHGLFRMLQSNADSQSLYRRYADLSDPPDLFGPLSEEQAPPPEEDLNPSDPDLVPREQELRFEGDLYTPKWVRGHGNKREGWCGICKPGRWLVLKNSAYWYDKSFSHGISAATGSPFQEPLETRRMDGNPDVWEGLCSSCNEWIALVSSKKKGTTWFRHAYKCHSHPKAKDTAKRRRDTSHARDSLTTSAKISKTEPTSSHVMASSIPNTSLPNGPMHHINSQGQTLTGMGLVQTPLSAHPSSGLVLGSNDRYPNMI